MAACMDYRLYQRLPFPLSVALFLCFGAAQAQSGASIAPPEQINRAVRAIEAAHESGAPALAPDSLALADAALADARALLARRKGKEAERQALRAIRYAELSANQARYIHLKETGEEKTADNARLRRELLLGESGEKP